MSFENETSEIKKSKPELILAVATHRGKNIGPVLRCAVGFGCSMIIIVGSPQYGTFGAHGAQKHIRVIHFYYWKEFYEYIKQKNNCLIFGLSHTSSSISTLSTNIELLSKPNIPIHETNFNNNDSVFMMGESNNLLTEEQLILCDNILHVPFPNSNLEKLVNYDSKVAICMHHFSTQAKFEERSVIGEKFHVQEPLFNSRNIYKGENKDVTLSRLEKKKTNNIIEEEDLGGFGGLFGHIDDEI
jgi:tRNA G18 (ribose-2'-O)-methylase SpoU